MQAPGFATGAYRAIVVPSKWRLRVRAGPATIGAMLTSDQRRAYARDGFLVLPGFKGAGEVGALRHRIDELIDAFEPAPSTGVFSTVERSRLADAALIASADAVHCFLEAEALDAEGRLVRPKASAVNKIGHALHDRDPVFDRFSRDPRLAELAADLGIGAPRLWQSMVICKPPSIGGEVAWHQDASFLATEPQTTTGLWFALDDADAGNGCLEVEPGGHRGPLRERCIRSGATLAIERVDATPWPAPDAALPLAAAAGTLVVFDGLLPHRSAPNRSPRRRLAYTLHLTDGRARYAPTNWLQRDGVRGF
jgi:phytanoyl-CoA hydroxylase